MASLGARVIFKSKYLNAAKNSSGGSGSYAQYIGTREGAVKISETLKNNPATDSQKKFINQILKQFPKEKDSIAYQEFKRKETIGKANEFINDMVEEHPGELASLGTYAQYMATRPGVVKIHDTGLFSDGNDEVNLKEVQDELKSYTGNVYLPIISLRPEDSIGLHYDNPDAWHSLIESHRDDFAKEYHIQPENFRWVGAFHHAINDDGIIHDHVHLMVWSKNPNEGWQTKQTGNNLRKVLANDIFHDEHLEILKHASETRDSIKEKAITKIDDLVSDITKNGLKTNDSSKLLSQEMIVLADSLKDYKGKKVYGFMKKDVKQIVDNITDDLFSQNPELKDLYKEWNNAKDAQVQIYKMGHYEIIPPSQNKEFNKIKNEIIKEAFKLCELKENEDFENLKSEIKEVQPNFFEQNFSNKQVSIQAAEKLLETVPAFKKTEEEQLLQINKIIERTLTKKSENEIKAKENEKANTSLKYEKLYKELEGQFKVFKAEDCDGSESLAKARTQASLKEALRKYNIKKISTVIKAMDKEEKVSLSELGDKTKNKNLSKAKKNFTNAVERSYISKATTSYKLKTASEESTAVLITKGIKELINSMKSPSRKGGTNKLAVDVDSEEIKRKIAMGMRF